jgi:hypoxanthine phosphoribosyltransferase
MNDWKKVFITPQKFHDDIIKLANMIPRNKYQCVIGLPRGGCIAAVYLSHFCDLEYFEFEDLQHISDIREALIVDDLVDTGKTLKNLKQGELEIKFDSAVVYYKPRSIVIPTYFVEQINNSDWIVFPYEKANEIPNRDI